MNKVLLLLGSNMGDRAQWIRRGLEGIETKIGAVVKRSSLYETAAWGQENQDAFLNRAVMVTCSLNAMQVLEQIRLIETELGRQRTEVWGPRTLDIDILFFNEEKIHSEALTIPHPRLQDRRFALVPLQEIAGAYMHPVYKKTINTLLEECTDGLPVTRFKSSEEQ